MVVHKATARVTGPWRRSPTGLIAAGFPPLSVCIMVEDPASETQREPEH